MTEEFDKEGSGADRGVEMEWPQVGAKNGRQGRRHCGGGWGGEGSRGGEGGAAAAAAAAAAEARKNLTTP